MELKFTIAGITWRVLLPEGTELSVDADLWRFAAETEIWNHTLEFLPGERIPAPEGELLYASPAMRVYGREGLRMRYEGPVEHFWEHARRCICRRGGHSWVYTTHAAPSGYMGGNEILNAMEAEHQIIRRGGFLLHASWIRWRDRAILFTAPSGTGKSTQAELWTRLRDAELINGDRAAVFLLPDGTAEVRGIPFSGSSGVGKNERMPLGAVVCLSQAPKNAVVPLRGFRAFRQLWEGCCVNLWDREDVRLCSDTLTRVLDRTPVYHLACTPDEGAVLTLEQELKGW